MGDATKYNLEDYTLECCPYCDCSEQVIFSKGITRCPNCGKPLAPCSVCEECTPVCPYGCDGTANDEFKTVTNRGITQEEIDVIYPLL